MVNIDLNLEEEMEFYFEELLEYDYLPDHTFKSIYKTGFKDCLRMLKTKIEERGILWQQR